ncbi:MAG TPA: cytochrome b/b6 domain-containing protein [Acidimicrobiales bacterium]|nr:cytochrome b/b6 domain-containing protein [Acidimicrobiales bacterium]
MERAAHWATAMLVLVLIATGTILYIPALSIAVGRRLLIEDIHVYSGIAVFVPVVLAVAGPWGRRLRRDLASMNRFTPGELDWVRSLGRRSRESVSKFNPGQKLNTFGIGAFLTVLLVTGLILRWGNFISVSWRTGATFMHDWFAIFLSAVILGHIVMAISHPQALRSMIAGWVTSDWAKRHAPTWLSADAASRKTARPRQPHKAVR